MGKKTYSEELMRAAYDDCEKEHHHRVSLGFPKRTKEIAKVIGKKYNINKNTLHIEWRSWRKTGYVYTGRVRRSSGQLAKIRKNKEFNLGRIKTNDDLANI